MKTYRKETFLISICTLFLFVFVFFSIGNATQTDVPETTGSVETTTTLSITGGTKSVFTPLSINFGELEVSSSQQEKNIELEAPNYFGIEDLKGQGGYYTTLQIGELSDGDKTLEVTEAKVRIANLEVHTIAGQEDSNISVPAGVSDFILFDSENPANILERAVTTNGKIGKYGVLPHMKLTIAAYQQVGDYEGTITFTIIEDGSISPIVYASCKELLDNRASSTSGVYTINPSGSEEFEVYCDMETDGGGWSLVAKVPHSSTNHNRPGVLNIDGLRNKEIGSTTSKLSDESINKIREYLGFANSVVRIEYHNSSNTYSEWLLRRNSSFSANDVVSKNWDYFSGGQWNSSSSYNFSSQVGVDEIENWNYQDHAGSESRGMEIYNNGCIEGKIPFIYYGFNSDWSGYWRHFDQPCNENTNDRKFRMWIK